MSASRIAAALLVAAGLVSCASAAAFGHDDRSYAAAVRYCRAKYNKLVLSEDRSIFCFDGNVSLERDASSLEALDDRGLFVVRSFGGSLMAAARIATVLEKKQATVVVYDYCISACARFFFIVGARTYVLRDSIVAWHQGSGDWSLYCDSMMIRSLDPDRRPGGGYCPEPSEQSRRVLDELRAIAEPLYKRRVVDPDRVNLEKPPQSVRTAEILQSRFAGTGYFKDFLWMLNPRYHKSMLRTEVVYEAYPESQEEVDVLAKRFFGKRTNSGYVLHDP